MSDPTPSAFDKLAFSASDGAYDPSTGIWSGVTLAPGDLARDSGDESPRRSDISLCGVPARRRRVAPDRRRRHPRRNLREVGRAVPARGYRLRCAARRAVAGRAGHYL